MIILNKSTDKTFSNECCCLCYCIISKCQARLRVQNLQSGSFWHWLFHITLYFPYP